MLAFARFLGTGAQNIPAGNPINSTSGDVILGTTAANTNAVQIVNAAGSAAITLQPGLYYLEGEVGASQASAAYIFYSFWDATNGVYLGQVGGHASGTASFGYDNPSGPATAVVQITVPTSVTLRVTASNASQTINQQPDGLQGGQSWVTVMQLG